MERAIKDLCQFGDDELFDEIAEGIGHVMDSVNRLESAVRVLHENGYYHPARALEKLAAEEAAKILVLLDVVRCPRNRVEEKSRTLGYFHDHLAKGIYARACDWAPVVGDLAEMKRKVEEERKEYHLDGPNDVDWIFGNDILRERENDLYVGYMRDVTEEGGQGVRCWMPPSNIGFGSSYTPQVVRVARALWETKATTPGGLSVIAGIWRSANVREEMQFGELRAVNRRTLEAMNERGVFASISADSYAEIFHRWIFPLWPLDLRIVRVDKKSLRDVREQSWFDTY